MKEEVESKYQVVEAIAGVSERRNFLVEVVVLFLWLKKEPAWKEILERYPDETSSFSEGLKILRNAFALRLEKFRFLFKNL